MRQSFVWSKDRNAFIPKADFLREQALERSLNRSGLPCPMIISDHLDGVRSMLDGRVYDSKSAYYASVKAGGCEIVGNDSSYVSPPAPTAYNEAKHVSDIASDVKTAIAQCEAKL